MSLDLWLAFAAASMVLLIVPGPTILLVVSEAIANGRPTALASVAGVGLGDLVATALSLVGLGALLAASASLFTIVKWVGAAYLVWLGIAMWRAPAGGLAADPTLAAGSRGKAFRRAFVVTALNPKGIVFFMAFAPQFIDPAGSFASQGAILVATFTLLGIVNAAGYALAASSARGLFRRPSVVGLANKIGGTLLIGAGVMTVAMRRA